MKNRSKSVVAIIILGLIASFFIFDLGHYFSLHYMQGQKQAFQEFYQHNQTYSVVVYFGIYILVTALSLPGAAVMTVVGGGIFGLALGAGIISFASTIGATCAFLAARFLLRDFVQNKFADKLQAVNQGIEKDGPFYLFTLRLIPIFPFFLINLVMGMTRLKTWQFYLVSQIGMLPGTLVYVNAGSELAKLDSLSGIMSPSLILSFALLGLFPLIAKKIVTVIQRSKSLKKYKKPDRYNYNLIVIGGGAAGLVSSYIAATVKAKVALVEKHKMGGDCLNTGCVPSKALIRSAKILNYSARAREFGFNKATVDFDFSTVMERVQRVISKVEPHDSVERYTKLGVDCIQGNATVLSPFEVEVNGRVLTTRNIIVATGARPYVPNLPGLEKIEALTSDTVWNIRELPGKLLVLGGGPIGCELAQCFARFGSKVSLIQRGIGIMPKEDPEISELIKQRLVSEGINVATEHQAIRVEITGGKKYLICTTKNGEVKLEFDQLLLALGRKANITGFGLEKLNLSVATNGTLQANEFLQSNYPNVFVCGDVTGPFQFTHVAAHQAWYASVNALFGAFKKFRVDYSVIPWATYTDPEVAHVGLNETMAKQRGIDYEVTRYGIDDLDRAIADEEDHGMVKVLTVPGKDKILGVTIVGSHAGDLIAEFVMAMKHKLGLNKILSTIHTYPTLSEANKYAAGVWKNKHKPEGLLQWLKKYHAWRRKEGKSKTQNSVNSHVHE